MDVLSRAPDRERGFFLGGAYLRCKENAPDRRKAGAQLSMKGVGLARRPRCYTAKLKRPPSCPSGDETPPHLRGARFAARFRGAESKNSDTNNSPGYATA